LYLSLIVEFRNAAFHQEFGFFLIKRVETNWQVGLSCQQRQKEDTDTRHVLLLDELLEVLVDQLAQLQLQHFIVQHNGGNELHSQLEHILAGGFAVFDQVVDLQVPLVVSHLVLDAVMQQDSIETSEGVLEA
jgi:hypothetical protein